MTSGRVIMIDCIIPSPANTINYAGTSQTGSGTSADIKQWLGASSTASLGTNFISSGGLSNDLIFKDEYNVNKTVLTDFSHLEDLQDVSYPTTLANGDLLYAQGGSWINKKLTYPDISGSLSFADITGQLDTATQLDNSGITIAGAFTALGDSITLDLQDLTDISFSTDPVAGEYLRNDGINFRNSSLLTSDLSGLVQNAQLQNSSLTVAGRNVSLGGSTGIELNDLQVKRVGGLPLIAQDRTYFTTATNFNKLNAFIAASGSFTANVSASTGLKFAEHSGMRESFREFVPESSLQIGFGRDGLTIEVDIDIHNPSFSTKEEILHFIEYGRNKFGGPTDPYDVQNQAFWECFGDKFIAST